MANAHGHGWCWPRDCLFQLPMCNLPLWCLGLWCCVLWYPRTARTAPSGRCGPCAGTAVNVTLLSYDGRATIGITTDRAAIPDKAQFTDCLDESLDEILSLADS